MHWQRDHKALWSQGDFSEEEESGTVRSIGLWWGDKRTASDMLYGPWAKTKVGRLGDDRCPGFILM